MSMQRMTSEKRALLLIAALLFVGGCMSAPVGTLGSGCSGVPGDFRNPEAATTAGEATHGPGAPSRVIERVATARPPGPTVPGDHAIPMLYVFDPDGGYVNLVHPLAELLRDPAFVDAANDAYWGEVVDDSFYFVPNLDKCSQAAMLDGDLNFLAPAGGIQFVQLVAPNCGECDEISTAIERVIATHPDLPVRWVRIAIPRSIGTLIED